jgi:hypothetical protein
MKAENLKKFCLLIAGTMVGILLGFFFSQWNHYTTGTTEKVETYIDTIPYYAPKPQSELVLGTSLYTLPTICFFGGGSGGEPRRQDSTIVAHDSIRTLEMFGTSAGGKPRCSNDSAIVVELPMIQRHYADSTYEAWVSGPIGPKLDSLRIFQPTTIITRQAANTSRWHIGVTTGYGCCTKGFQPYIGIGLTYSLISF